MPRKAKGKGKQVVDAAPPEQETQKKIDEFEDLDFTGLSGQILPVEDDEEDDDLENDQDDDEDSDNDSLDQWMQEDEVVIEDDEINNLLNSTIEKRSKLKTGGLDEFERDMEEFDKNLALTTGIGANKIKGAARKRIMAGEVRLSPEVKRLLGEANALYIARDYGSAIDILQKIIKDHPNAHPAWNTLGLVHEELGNKSKSLQLRMVAAHMCNDAHLWKELAQKSIENDAIKQAIYCFTKALVIEPSDVDALWDRSFLFKQLDRTTDAIDGFTKILEYMPHHFKVINELAQLYRAQGKTKEAIKMYEDAIAYHTSNPDDEEEEEEENEEEDEFSDKLGYSEINMLSELYLILNDYRRSLETIKTGLRHVQKRQNETWWADRADDDDEYLEEDESRTDFPIELRVRMGVCRTYLNQVEIASKHFQYLLQYPATTYPDLHQDIAYAYYDRRHYALALSVFQKIIDVSDEVEVDMLVRTADCYREIGELDTAVIFYVNVLDEQPENLDVLMSLATVYEEQGKEEQALELVDFVMKKNREIRKQKREANKNNEDDEDTTASEKLNKAREARRAKSKKSSIFDEHQPVGITQKEMYRRRKEDLQRQDEELSYSTLGLFAKLDELDKQIGSSLINLDKALMRDYMRSAQELWEDFSNTSAFYPAERSTRFQGFYALRRGKRLRTRDNINLEARHMANRLRSRVKQEDHENMDIDEEERQMMEEEERNILMIESTHFRNIPFDKWLRVFIKYAYMLALTWRANDAYELLKRAVEANVFYHDIPKKTALKLTLIGCGIVSQKNYIVQEGTRWLCNFYQFRNDPFRIYAATIDSGNKATNSHGDYNQLKYLSRIMRLMDALVANKRKEDGNENTRLEEIRELNDAILAMNVDPSTANEQNYSRFYHIPESVKRKNVVTMGIDAPTQVNPLLISLFGHMMNLTKNHVAASLFYMRAYAVAPKDRLNTLSLGLALLHVATSRKVHNRHIQVMQGMMFVFEYVALTGHTQESEYNVARAFHLLGLTHLAVPHYEKVLCMPPKSKQAVKNERPVDSVYKWPLSKEEEEELEEEADDDSDLKREAAYNLHLIYITSGSMNLAQILLMKYCSI